MGALHSFKYYSKMEEKNNDYKIQETKKSHFTDIFGLFQTLCYWSPHKDKDCEKVHLNFPLSLFIIMRVAFRPHANSTHLDVRGLF